MLPCATFATLLNQELLAPVFIGLEPLFTGRNREKSVFLGVCEVKTL
jgi:hypothetical protein